jgi:hypothetical protein
MFHQGPSSRFHTRSFNLYAHLGLGYGSLGLGDK